MTRWATYFDEIPAALEENGIVRETALELVEGEPIHAKALEGGDREPAFKEILRKLISGDYSIKIAIQQVSKELPQSQSPYSYETAHTFNRQWKERLVRSELSRFYNHAVLLILNGQGDETCFVPESPRQDRTKKCTQLLAEREASVPELLSNLERAYRNQDWDLFPRIPYKPNCTHTITPIE